MSLRGLRLQRYFDEERFNHVRPRDLYTIKRNAIWRSVSSYSKFNIGVCIMTEAYIAGLILAVIIFGFYIVVVSSLK